MAADASLRGADNLVRTLHDAARQLEDLTDAEKTAGQLLAQAGSKAAPRQSGRLAAAHGYTIVAAVLTVVAATPYAAIVHARKPWLTDTVVDHDDQVADIYLASVTDALATVKGI
jgi:hypothetical protein